MQYMLLFYEDERSYQSLSPSERQAIVEQYETYAGQMAEAGVLQGGSELAPTSTATTVRRSGGKVVTTDGPFAETKEQLGGYMLIEVPSLDEALAWAKRGPGVVRGSVEVRPLVVTSPE